MGALGAPRITFGTIKMLSKNIDAEPPPIHIIHQNFLRDLHAASLAGGAGASGGGCGRS